MTKRALIFQHMQDDDPGRISQLLGEDGFAIETIYLSEGQSIPGLAEYDLLLVLGGAMDVWQVEEHPWLVAEQQAIREWVADRAKPYIGICLGHQLLASAMGGTVGLADRAEIGLHSIAIEPDTDHVLVDGLEDVQRVLQWHLAEVKQPPDQAHVLASSSAAAVQALAIGEHALGVQFHFEWTLDNIRNWPQGWQDALHDRLGEGAHAKLVADAQNHMAGISRMTRTIYGNLKRANGL